MPTKVKCVPHLKPGDVVCWEGKEEERYRWPVLKVEPHAIMSEALVVHYTYERFEPDGEGGTKTVVEVSKVVYDPNEVVQILV